MAKPVRLTLYVDNDQMKRAFRESGEAADNFGNKVSHSSLSISKAAVAVGTAVGTMATDFAAKLGQMVIDAAKFLPQLGAEFDDVADHIRVSVGNNPVLNGELEASFERVLPKVSSGMDEVGRTVVTLNQRLGVIGAPLDALAQQVLDLSRITGTDLATNLEAVTTAFNIFNVPAEQMGSALDYIFKASQAVDVPFDTIASDVQSNAASMQILGVSFEQAVAASAQLNKAGVSLDELDQSFKRLIATAAKNGTPVSDVLDAEVRGIQDGSITIDQALQDLGTRGGATFFALAQQGKLNFGDLRSQIEASTDTVEQASNATKDWPEKWGESFNAIKLSLKDLSGSVFDEIGKILDILVVKDEAGNVTGLNLAGAWDEIARYWQEDAWPKIQPVLEDFWNKLIEWWNSDDVQSTVADIGVNIGKAIVNGIIEGVKATATSPDFLDSFTKALPFANPGSAGMAGLGALWGKVTGNATGGDVQAGMPTIVGEHRRELFVPKVDGHIYPSVGGMGDHVTFNISGASDPRSVALEAIRQRRAVAFLAGGR